MSIGGMLQQRLEDVKCKYEKFFSIMSDTENFNLSLSVRKTSTLGLATHQRILDSLNNFIPPDCENTGLSLTVLIFQVAILAVCSPAFEQYDTNTGKQKCFLPPPLQPTNIGAYVYEMQQQATHQEKVKI